MSSLSPDQSSLSLSSPSPTPSPNYPNDLQREQWGVKLNTVVIMAAVVCAVVCAVGLNSMLKCILQCLQQALREPVGWIAARRSNSGLREKDVVSLPTSVYPVPGSSLSLSLGCAICLLDFRDGDTIRILPNCNHGFHLLCIDRWLISHSSCPTCRFHLNP